jgi:hypothetical protein
MIAASPDQRSRILRFAVAVEGEIITPASTKEKQTAAMIAKKNLFGSYCQESQQSLKP